MLRSTTIILALAGGAAAGGGSTSTRGGYNKCRIPIFDDKYDMHGHVRGTVEVEVGDVEPPATYEVMLGEKAQSRVSTGHTTFAQHLSHPFLSVHFISQHNIILFV